MLLERSAPDGTVIGIDMDPAAIAAANATITQHLPQATARFFPIKENYTNIKQIAYAHHVRSVAGILLDLGISSGQLQDQLRGFSFLARGTLDMRFGPEQPFTAADLLATSTAAQLTDLFKKYGEEPLAYQIARSIVAARKLAPITTPEQLVTLVAGVYKRHFRSRSKHNPATRVFQALRIAVNQELENLQRILPAAVDLLETGGRLAVISYHSLEDRIVKQFFALEARDCICPPERPTCQCGHHASLMIVTPKPIIPTDEEQLQNPRSRSAKLRVAQRRQKN